MLIKSVDKSLKLLLPQEKLKIADYTDAIFIAEKLALCYHRFKGDASHCLLLSHEMLFFSTENIEQNK